jgi:hypothetical protein
VDFQPDTFKLEFIIDQSCGDLSARESSIAKIHVIEILKYHCPAPDNMICLGRDENSDIVLYNAAISSLHAYIIKSKDGDSHAIMDADSTNGTTVNDQKLVSFERQSLVNLDRFELGTVIRSVYMTPRGFFEFLEHLTRIFHHLTKQRNQGRTVLSV